VGLASNMLFARGDKSRYPRHFMSTLSTNVDGLNLPNPFIIASGPPGTNLNVIHRDFREGWGAVIAKTISLDASKVINVTPRYGKLHANDKREIVGWENIELISDRPLRTGSRSLRGARIKIRIGF
jgi:dihydroorotate dehydrogenase